MTERVQTSMEEEGNFMHLKIYSPVSFSRYSLNLQHPFSHPTRYTHFRAPISIFTHPTLELNYTPKVGWDEAATRLRGDHKEDSFHSFLSQLCHFVTFFFLLTFFLFFFFSIPFFHLWTRLFFNDYQWSFVDIRIINYLSFL